MTAFSLTVALVAIGPPAAERASAAPLRDASTAAEIDPTHLVVRFNPHVSAAQGDAVLRRHRLTRGRTDAAGYVKVATSGRDVGRLRSQLAADSAVASADFDLVRRALEAPNDPEYTSGNQPGLDLVRLPLAWDTIKGADDLVIAVVDSGIEMTHPDLATRVLPGYDFVDNDALPQDEAGHGTEVAGVAAATTNNAVGIAGAAWTAKILPVRVLDNVGTGSDSNVAAGIRWAVSHGADVINLSLGGYGSSNVLRDAVAEAVAADVVVVAAAGNLGSGTLFKEPVFPAAYPGVLGVAATTNSGEVVEFSLHGPWVDLAAPGYAIRVTKVGADYATVAGTSFASPLVAGIAGLVRSQHPTWTRAQVDQQLTDTARDTGPSGRDDAYGFGLVDAAAAVGPAATQAAVPPAPGDALEPNNTRTTPSLLSLGTARTATIAPEEDVDWFRLPVPGNQRVTVKVTPPAPESITRAFDPILRIYGPDGSLLVERDIDPSGLSESATFDVVAGGDHFVQLENFVPTLGGSPYSLLASATPLSPASTTTSSTTTVAPATTTTVAPTTTVRPTTTTTAPASPPSRSGYWMVSAAGAVYGFGDAGHFGNAGPLPAGMRAVDIEPTPSLGGYWIVTDTGHLYTFGDAPYLGSINGALNAGEAVTSISATPSGRGYWLFTTRGRVVAFGDAVFRGDMSAARLNGPVLDSIPTPSGHGYYMVASDGGIFTFGDARFQGSMGGTRLNAPVQSLVPDGDGSGYWLVASDGGIFSFDAPFRGSMGSVRLNGPITGMVRFGNGYLMVGTDGGIFTFTDKAFFGSLGANPPPSPIAAVAVAE